MRLNQEIIARFAFDKWSHDWCSETDQSQEEITFTGQVCAIEQLNRLMLLTKVCINLIEWSYSWRDRTNSSYNISYWGRRSKSPLSWVNER